MTATYSTFHEIAPTLVGYFFPVVVGHRRRADSSAVLAKNLKGVPARGTVSATHFFVDSPNNVRVSENHIDGVIELPGAIYVANAVKLRMDTKLVKDPPKLRDVVIRHVRS